MTNKKLVSLIGGAVLTAAGVAYASGLFGGVTIPKYHGPLYGNEVSYDYHSNSLFGKPDTATLEAGNKTFVQNTDGTLTAVKYKDKTFSGEEISASDRAEFEKDLKGLRLALLN